MCRKSARAYHEQRADKIEDEKDNEDDAIYDNASCTSSNASQLE